MKNIVRTALGKNGRISGIFGESQHLTKVLEKS
jgi:hypothetical protein